MNSQDPYTEVYIRRWFEAYAAGSQLTGCARDQQRTWSIGSNGGVVRPLIMSLAYPEHVSAGLGAAITHQVTTHVSENVSATVGVLVPMLNELVHGADWESAVRKYASLLRLPKITGKQLLQQYRDAKGPGNIPVDEMHALHTTWQDEPFDPFALNDSMASDEVIRHHIGTICYTEHAVPLMLYLWVNQRGDFANTLLLNANAGGDSCNRGSVLGLLAGAAAPSIPEELKKGLTEYEAIRDEINAFLDTIEPGPSDAHSAVTGSE
eukprot:TRINITY_DN58936_c0_g1_i2.p1 TRINITY_DN58936_c0_g1~~TRINITY_DN58936_c0_g1_i2.p1  ORF type:complete len:265 (-),score=106.24 TRINITY_DN58936_c0_g1_i2:93-887(-)